MEDKQILVTRYLQDIASGDEEAVQQLLPHVYDDLRSLARRMYRSNPQDHTLQPTALVHEAYVRLVRSDHGEYEGRRHFMHVAALAMRQLLSNYARERARLKRGGGHQLEEFQESVILGSSGDTVVDVLDLDEALGEFRRRFPRQAQVVELRFFTGLTVEESAEILQVSLRTAKSDWQFAKAWLSRALDGAG